MGRASELRRRREDDDEEQLVVVGRAGPAKDGFVGVIALVRPARAHRPVHRSNDEGDGAGSEHGVGGNEQVVQST